MSSVAIRIPAHPAFLSVITAAGRPLVAPSANLFGRTSPTTAEHVYQQLAGRIPYILDGGPTHVGLESTIVRLESDGSLTLMRPGGVSADQLTQVSGRPLQQFQRLPKPAHYEAPGLMESHYAPSTRSYLIHRADLYSTDTLFSRLEKLELQPAKIGILIFGEAEPWQAAMRRWSNHAPGRHIVVETLPFDDEGQQAAAGLFAAMHRLDAANLDLLLIEMTNSDRGLWPAITDRLKRATAKCGRL